MLATGVVGFALALYILKKMWFTNSINEDDTEITHYASSDTPRSPSNQNTAQYEYEMGGTNMSRQPYYDVVTR